MTFVEEKINSLEKERKKGIARLRNFALFVMAFGVGAGFFIFQSGKGLNSIGLILSALFAFLIIFLVFMSQITNDSYKRSFSRIVILPTIKQISSKLDYFPKRKIQEYDFKQSGLVNQKFDEYKGDNYISGEYSGINVEMSNVEAILYIKTGEHGGNHDITLFDGFLLKGTLKKPVDYPLYIYRDIAEKTLGRVVGRFMQKIAKPKRELMQLDSPSFEKEFVAYTKDQIYGRYILTNSFMEDILEFKNSLGFDVALTFTGKHFYIGVYNFKISEPSFFTKTKSEDLIRNINELNLILSFAEKVGKRL